MQLGLKGKHFAEVDFWCTGAMDISAMDNYE